ncbi:hypothetical protein ACA910_020322 [Epithemia clementina (nom. ined.)]
MGAFALSLSSSSSSFQSTTTIRVCQNKHCFKKYPNLLQTVSNYYYWNAANGDDNDNNNNIMVEASGCLSLCDLGPNVELVMSSCNPNTKKNNPKPSRLKSSSSSEAVILHGMTDATIVADQLQQQWQQQAALSTNFEASSSFGAIPTLLVAACKVMDKATLSIQDPKEQIRLLDSVITKLEAQQQQEEGQPLHPHRMTAALAHAYALRGKAYLELAEVAAAAVPAAGQREQRQLDTTRTTIIVEPNVVAAMRNAQQAIEAAQPHKRPERVAPATPSKNKINAKESETARAAAATTATLSLAYRVWADALEAHERSLRLVSSLPENKNDENDEQQQKLRLLLLQQRVVVLQEWSRVQPSFSTKLQKELQQALALLQQLEQQQQQQHEEQQQQFQQPSSQ